MSRGSLLSPSINTGRKMKLDAVRCTHDFIITYCIAFRSFKFYRKHKFYRVVVLPVLINEFCPQFPSKAMKSKFNIKAPYCMFGLEGRRVRTEGQWINTVLFITYTRNALQQPGSLNQELIHHIPWSAQTTGLYNVPVSSSELLLQPPVRAVTVFCSSTYLFDLIPQHLTDESAETLDYDCVEEILFHRGCSPLPSEGTAMPPSLSLAARKRRPRTSNAAAERDAAPSASQRQAGKRSAERLDGPRPGPGAGRGGAGRPLAASGMDSRPPVSARHHFGRGGGRGGARAVPAVLRALRGAQVPPRAGGSRRRVPAVARGVGEAAGGPAACQIPPAVVGERLPARLRGAEGARPDPPRSAACPEGGFPLPVACGRRGRVCASRPEVPSRRLSVRSSCPALAPARSTRGCRTDPALPPPPPSRSPRCSQPSTAFWARSGNSLASPSSVRTAFTRR